MIFQYISIIFISIWKYYKRRFYFLRAGQWYFNRHRTGHLMLTQTIELCDELRKKISLKERNQAIARAAKIELKRKVYAGNEDGQELDS